MKKIGWISRIRHKDIKGNISANFADRGAIRLCGFGTFEPDIFIMPKIFTYLCDYAKEDTKNERACILLGEIIKIRKKKLQTLLIDAVVRVKFADSSPASIKFTQKSWSYINKEIDSKYPNKKIVGWFHTHPNFGIFLSKYDLFIHENFFNALWQIAYVLDPLRNEAGLFYWDKSKLIKVNLSTKKKIDRQEPKNMQKQIKNVKEKRLSPLKKMFYIVTIFAILEMAIILTLTKIIDVTVIKQRIQKIKLMIHDISHRFIQIDDYRKMGKRGGEEKWEK